MFYADEKFAKRAEELSARRYFGHQSLFPLQGTEDKLGRDAVRCTPPDVMEATFQQGDVFGGRDHYLWLRKQCKLPQPPQGCHLVGLFDFGQTGSCFLRGFEGLLYVDDTPYQGIDSYHKEVVFTPEALNAEALTFQLWSGLNDLDPTATYEHKLARAELAFLHKDTDSLYYYTKTIADTLPLLRPEDSAAISLRAALEEALALLDWDDDCYFFPSASKALAALQSRIAAGPKQTDATVSVVGHTHLDVAWLWRLKHTREKAQRSFSTALHLMDQYPETIFLQSQPQLYEYLKTDSPGLYARICEKAGQGSWETDGGMWLEADCNIPSGESLVRQFLYGIRFFEQAFGHKCTYLWLPDVFGYSWALPQILKLCGIRTFMTTKISWNQYNSIPHDLFRWRGIDGSEVLTYFVNTPGEGQDSSTRYTTYNGMVSPHAVLGSWRNFKDKALTKNTLISYGYGDGGGGITRDMLETRRRLDELPGLPRVAPTTAGAFFEKIHADVAQSDAYLHTWDGELYLEYHRGTYTSQAHNKQMNRTLEAALLQAEALGCLSLLSGYGYEADTLHKAWNCVLLHQFHDIIPGSSIHEVYEDSRAAYAQAQAALAAHRTRALEGLAHERRNSYTLFSTAPLASQTVARIEEPRDGSFWLEGARLSAQRGAEDWLVHLPLMPFTLQELRFEEGSTTLAASPFHVNLDAGTLEAPGYSIAWGENGQLVRIFDKLLQRELVAEGGANRLEIYEDKPLEYDAWDIDIFYTQKMEHPKLEGPVCVLEDGPLCVTLGFAWQYRKSRIRQRMTVYTHSQRIDFATEVDWQERHRLLKTAFYTNVRSPKATFDIQFGSVERPTHWNTSWDWARFEVCAHKWADLSQHDYGISLLNNCKYGYSVKDNAIKLSLLKSATYPDATADVGTHSFTYSLLPHQGAVLDGPTPAEADALNHPPLVAPGLAPKAPATLLAVQGNIQLDAVKKAEDADALVVRLHEYKGGAGIAELQLGFAAAQAVECDLLEKPLAPPMPMENDTLQLELKPFEIKTLLLYPAHKPGGGV